MARQRFDWREDLERLGERLDDFLDGIVDLATGPRNSFQSRWRPAVDIFEVDGGLVVIAELPGIDETDVSVTVEHNRLRIAGTRRPPKVARSTGPLQLEIGHGPFERIVALPDGTESEQIDAQFRQGLLTIHIPRSRNRTSVHVRGEDNPESHE
jgi:HSP20 family protein